MGGGPRRIGCALVAGSQTYTTMSAGSRPSEPNLRTGFAPGSGYDECTGRFCRTRLLLQQECRSLPKYLPGADELRGWVRSERAVERRLESHAAIRWQLHRDRDPR